MRKKTTRLFAVALALGAFGFVDLMGQPCATPTGQVATPSTICTGASSQLTATSAGNNIVWYDVPTGGVALGTVASGANFAVSPTVTTTYYAEAIGIANNTQTFSYTGAAQSFTVPSGVTSITFDIQGAQGGTGFNAPAAIPGMGGRVQGTITTTPGEVLQINVGGQGGPGGTTIGGTAGWNGGGVGGGWSGGRSGGGGGGATDIRRGGTALTNRILVAAGGGGTGVNFSSGNAGGNGGGLTGANGLTGSYLGGGATQSAGGTPNGVLGIGGPGGTGQTGGGGGGGYYGGGGSAWEGGGGGSSWATTTGTSGIVHTAGFRTGNGVVTLTWTGTACTASNRVPVTVTVGPLGPATNVMATPSLVCPGSPINLSATSTGTSIAWYTVASGGTPIGISNSGANFVVAPTSNTTYYAEAMTPGSGSQSFAYTGAAQSFTVPGGIIAVTYDIQGAQGGFGYNVPGVTPGLGGRLQGTISTTPGEVWNVYVGGQGGTGGTTVGGTAGWNGGGVGGGWSGGRSGGGGGGASDIRRTGTALTDRILVAAGGGGTGVNHSTGDAGGNGGGLVGVNGLTGTYLGGGATQTAGGTPNGLSGVGGAGGTGQTGGGGGGGYFGGGGSPWEGGGGGSSWATTVGTTGVVHTAGFRTGNGVVNLSWTGNGCVAAVRVPITVVLDSVAPTATCVPVTVQLDQFGNGSTDANAVGSGSTDNCGVDTLILSQTAFTCSDAGINNLTLSATDENGNIGTCTAMVTVLGPAMTNTVYADSTTCGFNLTCPNGNDGVAHAITGGGCPGYTFLWSNGAQTPIATGLAAGNISVTISDASGSTSVHTLTLTSPPAIQVTSTTTSSCTDATDGAADITASGGSCLGGFVYAWSNGATTEDITNVAPGTYTVTVTDASGCDFVQTVVVPALPTPNPTFTVAGVTLTSGQTWVTYQWVLNGNNIPGATNPTFTATQSGNYALLVTNADGCSGISVTTNVTVVGTIGSVGGWEELSIYPNPTRNEFRLRTPSPIGYGITVSISDIFGRSILTQALPELGHEVAFDVKALAVGTYMVEVTSEMGQKRVFRLVVE